MSINGRNDPKRLRLLAFDAWVKNNETREKTKKSAEDESLIMVSANMNTFDNDYAGLWSLTSTSFCLFVIISFPPWHKQELHSTIPSLSTRIPMGKDNRAQSRHPLGHNSRNISSTKLLPIIPKNHSRNARPLHWSFAIPTSKRHAPLDLLLRPLLLQKRPLWQRNPLMQRLVTHLQAVSTINISMISNYIYQHRHRRKLPNHPHSSL